MNRKRLSLIIAHEYKMLVMRKSFLVMTFLMPFLILLIGAVPILISELNNSSSGSSADQIVVIDYSKQQFGLALHSNDKYEFVELKADQPGSERDLWRRDGANYLGMLVIGEDVLNKPKVSMYSDQTLSVDLTSYVRNCLNDTLTQAKIDSWGIADLRDIIDQSTIDVDVDAVKLSDDGGEQMSSSEFSLIVGMALAFFIYMFVLTYGAMIMNDVVEEKTNRIVEVIVSSCKPMELMMGKIIGVGLVGLSQMAIWGLLLSLGSMLLGTVAFGASFLGSGMPDMAAAAAQAGGEADTTAKILGMIASVNFGAIFFNFVLYFVGGYLLYAAMFAAFGSAVDQASDASQFTMPVMIVMIIALYAGIACAENPNGPMAVWCSIIPFTSPVVMMVRLPFEVPMWQFVASYVALFATAALIVWAAARIYRGGILMYGKKPSFASIFRHLRHK